MDLRGENAEVDKKHHEELTAVASAIYDKAADEIQAYIQKKYGSKKENTLVQQMEDFHIIADEVSAYLVGNAMAMVDESCWDDDLKTLNKHIQQIATYVAGAQKAQLGPVS